MHKIRWNNTNHNNIVFSKLNNINNYTKRNITLSVFKTRKIYFVVILERNISILTFIYKKWHHLDLHEITSWLNPLSQIFIPHVTTSKNDDECSGDSEIFNHFKSFLDTNPYAHINFLLRSSITIPKATTIPN